MNTLFHMQLIAKITRFSRNRGSFLQIIGLWKFFLYFFLILFFRNLKILSFLEQLFKRG